MQLLIGNKGKSVTIHHIINSTNSVCYVYDTGWVPVFKSILVDSNEVTISKFSDLLDLFFNELCENNQHFDYLIIYTNKKQEEIRGVLDWLESNSHRSNSVEILVTCK